MNGLTALGAMSKLADVLKTADKDAPVSGTGTSFADLLAQAVAGETNGDAIAPEKLTQLAEVVSQFRGEARETLTDLFPDGVVTAGPKLMEWAQNMLTRLDTMLGDIGASVADLGQVLSAVPRGSVGEVITAERAGPEGQDILAQAARLLEPDRTVTPSPETQAGLDATAASSAAPRAEQTIAPAVPINGSGRGGAGQPIGTPTDAAAVPTGQQPNTAPAQSAVSTSVIAAVAPPAQPTVTPANPFDPRLATKPSVVNATVAGTGDPAQPSVDVGITSLSPMPEALRLILSQALIAPADPAAAPEVQSIFAATTPAPLVQAVTPAIAAAVPTPAQQQAPQSGFARNLAGQIRGVSFSEGTTRIELSPQGLGGIEIEISPDEAGKLRVVLRAENPAVLNAMRSDREMLASLLRDGGATVEDSAMSFEDLGQRRGTSQQHSEPGLTAFGSAEADEIEELPDMTDPVPEDGRINILT